MKRVFQALTASVLAAALFVLCACGAPHAGSTQSPAPSETQSPEPTASPEPTKEPALAIPLKDGAVIGEVGEGREVYRYFGQDVSRRYFYYIPSTYQEGDKLPLMLALHGSGSSAKLHMEETNWVKYAEQEGIIVVIPDSVYIHKDKTLSSEGKSVVETKQNDYNFMRWNAARTDPVSAYHVDDVKYLSDLIDIFVAEGYVDEARVYASGMSHGGFMCLRLALEIPEKLAGIGVVCGAFIAEYDMKKLTDQTKIVFINGTADTTVPIDGMVYENYIWAYSLEDSIAWFLNKFGMENLPSMTQLPDTDPNDGTTIARYQYDDAEGVTQIVSYVIDGGGHAWPGANMGAATYFGRSSCDAQGVELIWTELKDTVNDTVQAPEGEN